MDDTPRKPSRWLRPAAAPATLPDSVHGTASDALDRIRTELGSTRSSGAITTVPAVNTTQENTMENAASPLDKALTGSVLCAGTDIKVGAYKSEGDLTIYCHWEGTIDVGKLFVGEGGSVIGEVTAAEIRNHGSMDGKITAGSLVLYRGSQLTGEVRCRMLGVQQGSTLKAQVSADSTQEIAPENRADSHLESAGFESEVGNAASNLRVVSTR